ncbi:MAG: hypothetical protein HYV16_01955 [Gammaproteobacteria bacterium]|nr:hypothetical protein [Gammaproteobacteria bacterium]
MTWFMENGFWLLVALAFVAIHIPWSRSRGEAEEEFREHHPLERKTPGDHDRSHHHHRY